MQPALSLGLTVVAYALTSQDVLSHSPFLVLSPLSSLEVAEDQKKKSHPCQLCSELCYDPHLARTQQISRLSNYFWVVNK